MALELMYITNDPKIAIIAEEAGVDRIWIDLETLGKEERQKGMNTVKSNHSISDIEKIAPLLSKSKLQVRVNPWNEKSREEIENVIEAGAEYIMLPMWKSAIEVKNFLDCVKKRTKTILLLETKEANECLDEVLLLKGIDEIHIGLNDLHLSYGLKFMFELLSNGTVEKICDKISNAGIPYGFGGVSHLGDGMLPAEKILMEHYRLGSTRVILSRGFCPLQDKSIEQIKTDFLKYMKDFREYEEKIPSFDIQKNKNDVIEIINSIVEVK